MTSKSCFCTGRTHDLDCFEFRRIKTPMAPLRMCPVCMGEGRVYRMTEAYEAMAIVAGGTFGWTGETHEWRTCKPCDGKGVL